jgi:membrane protein
VQVRGTLNILKRIYSDWDRHDDPRLGATLAFYTVLSLSPLMILTVAIAAFFFDRSMVIREITGQIQSLIGSGGAQAVQKAIESAQNSRSGGIASIVSLLVLLFGASGVCGELRSSLNRIWEVRSSSTIELKSLLRDRFFSFAMVLGIGFMLVAALILSAVLTALAAFIGHFFPSAHSLAFALDVALSLLGLGFVFALIFRYVPSADVSWRQAWTGGLITSVLFAIGKYLIGLYLAKAAPGSAYGAAGSVVVIIVWVYYTAQIIFLGAEFTHIYPELSAASAQREHNTAGD